MATIEEWDALEERYKRLVTPVPFDLDDQIKRAATAYVLQQRQAHHRPTRRISKKIDARNHRWNRYNSLDRPGSSRWVIEDFAYKSKKQDKIGRLLLQEGVDLLYDALDKGNSPLPIVVDTIALPISEDDMQRLRDLQYINHLTGFVPVNA
jgi:hypothetical protein